MTSGIRTRFWSCTTFCSKLSKKYLVRLLHTWKTYLLFYLKWKSAGFVGDLSTFCLQMISLCFLLLSLCLLSTWESCNFSQLQIVWRWSGKIYVFPLLQLIIFCKLFLAWSCFCLGRGFLLKVCRSLPKEPFSLISARRKLVAVLVMKLVWFYGWRFLSFSEGKIFTKGIRFVSFLVLGAFENILLSGGLPCFKLLPRT